MLGTEKYCPECGSFLIPSTLVNTGEASDENNNISSKRDEIHLGSVGRNVTGVGVSGDRHRIAGTIIENVTILSVSPEYLPMIKNISSMPVSLPPITTSSPHIDINKDEIKHDRNKISSFLQKIADIDKEERVHIEQIKAGDLQISRTELQLKDLISEGNVYYYKGDYMKSIAYYDEALKIDGNYVDAWYNKGLAFGNLGRYAEAIQCYNKALEIDKKYANAWYGKGYALDELGKYDEAIQSYDKALEIDKKHADAWTSKGIALRKLGRYAEAIQCHNKALEIDKKHVNAWINRGVALDDLGKYDEAIQSYDKALEIDKKYANAWYNRGIALDNLGKYDEAIQSYDKALEIDKKYANAWYNRGISIEKLGKHKEAKECYERAKQLG
jgi:tetratricopeptide (TPR) repeat protein